MIAPIVIPFTTDAAGDATAYGVNQIPGTIRAIKYEPGDVDTNADLVITGDKSGIAILTKANAGTATVLFYPMALVNKVTDGAASAITETPVFVTEEKIKVVVAQGGDTKTGTITVYVDQRR